MASTRRPKVLFVTHKHPPSLGGMQRQSFELVRNYRQIGDASLIAYNSRYPVWMFFLIVVPWVAIKLAIERDIELIHGNDGLMGVFLTPFLVTRRKLFVTAHGLDIVLGSRLYQWWVRTWLRRFDGIIAVSWQTAEACIARGIPEPKVGCVLNACDRDWTDDPDPGFTKWLKDEHGLDWGEKVIIASVGRPVPRKGFSWFASEVLPKLPDTAVYLIVGPKAEESVGLRLLRAALPPSAFKSLCHAIGIGTDYVKLRDILETPNMAGRLVMLGALSRDQLNQLYLHAQILAMPNLKVDGDFEGFGLVAQEAAYNGALCLAADADGIPSAIRDGETGILLPSGAPTPWVNKIAELCAEPGRLEGLAMAFQQNVRADDYGWKHVALAYRERFEKAFAAAHITPERQAGSGGDQV